MTHPIMEKMEQGVLLCDGAMGTQLIEMGLQSGEAPEALNLSEPDKIKAIHQSYFEAGCRVLLTNTFGGSALKLKGHGLEDKVHEYNFHGARLAREVVGQKGFVAASMGPTGRFLQPLGDVSFEEMEESFHRQAVALIEGGADAICVETMMDPQEAVAAIKGVKKAADIPVLATMTFNADAKGYRTMMGTDPATAAEELARAGADVIGVNCVVGPGEALEIIREMRNAVNGFPLMAQPNAGLPVMEGGKTVYPLGPDEMADGMKRLIEEGVNVIGGCCGTTPQHIRLMADLLIKT
jgi:5-methyltetrahydrofolate--homocysteine methyltransferase